MPQEEKKELGAPRDTREVRQDAVDTILEKGIDFTITVQNTNILHKLKLLPTKRKFVIRPITMGTLLKISKILLGMDASELTNAMKGTDKGINFLDLGAKNIVENKDKLIQMVAYGIVNQEKEPPKRLIKFLNENLTAKEALKLLTAIIQQMNINPFLASLISMKGINLLETKEAATHGES